LQGLNNRNQFNVLLDKESVSPAVASAPAPTEEKATTTPIVDAPPLAPDYSDATTTLSAASSSVQ
jgi:hypothetical protein